MSRQNTKYGFIVKPTVRLIKYWNASHGYPYKSFELEKNIANQDFSRCTYQKALGIAIDNLNSGRLTNMGKTALQQLRANYTEMIHLLDNGKVYEAKRVLGKILPEF